MRAPFLFSVAFAGTSVLAGQSAPAGPRGVSDDVRFASITAGAHHTCGLTAEGRAYCWGRNNAGQLGDSSTTDRSTPVPVAGGYAFLQITTGDNHTCAITVDDEPYCWGANQHGQLGNGGRANATYPFAVAGNLRAHAIVAGGLHTCATQKHWDKQYRAVCWGKNDQGQLGTMSPDDAALPTETFGVIRYLSIAAGATHTCGATQEGKIFCWGANERGQLGNGSITFSRVPFLTRMNRREKFTLVVAGAMHSCALTAESEVYCWGENGAGQVGNGKSGARVVSPTLLRDSVGFTGVTAGGAATCALRPDGSAACWGSNTAGQFGTASSPGVRAPASALPGAAWKALTLGATHGCGLGADGTASCWGVLEP